MALNCVGPLCRCRVERLEISNGLSRQYKKSALMIMTLQGEDTLEAGDNSGSTSSQSESSCDIESMVMAYSSLCNFARRHFFMSKAIHPFSFPSETPTREATFVSPTGLSEFDAITLHRDKHHVNNCGSVDITKIREPLEYDPVSIVLQIFSDMHCVRGSFGKDHLGVLVRCQNRGYASC